MHQIWRDIACWFGMNCFASESHWLNLWEVMPGYRIVTSFVASTVSRDFRLFLRRTPLVALSLATFLQLQATQDTAADVNHTKWEPFGFTIEASLLGAQLSRSLAFSLVLFNAFDFASLDPSSLGFFVFSDALLSFKSLVSLAFPFSFLSGLEASRRWKTQKLVGPTAWPIWAFLCLEASSGATFTSTFSPGSVFASCPCKLRYRIEVPGTWVDYLHHITDSRCRLQLQHQIICTRNSSSTTYNHVCYNIRSYTEKRSYILYYSIIYIYIWVFP